MLFFLPLITLKNFTHSLAEWVSERWEINRAIEKASVEAAHVGQITEQSTLLEDHTFQPFHPRTSNLFSPESSKRMPKGEKKHKNTIRVNQSGQSKAEGASTEDDASKLPTDEAKIGKVLFEKWNQLVDDKGAEDEEQVEDKDSYSNLRELSKHHPYRSNREFQRCNLGSLETGPDPSMFENYKQYEANYREMFRIIVQSARRKAYKNLNSFEKSGRIDS